MRIRDFLTALTLLVLAFVVYGIIAGGWIRPRGELVIAAGPDGGAYAVFADELSEQLRLQEGGRLKPTILSTSGSSENIELLREGKAQFALVQSSPPNSNGINLIAPLYSEILHILIRRDDAESINGVGDLSGKQVVVGETASGTFEVVDLLLEHFAVRAETITLDAEKGVQKLLDGEADAVCFLAAMHAPVLDQALASGRLSLISLESPSRLEGLCSRTPHLSVTTIPPASYEGGDDALPATEIVTIGLDSLLVCSEDVSHATVRVVAEALFRGRSRMSAYIPGLAEIQEPDATRWLPYPVHRGADSYYRRGEPGFLERYAEVIALLFSLGLSIMAGIGALRNWASRKRKNLTEAFYRQLGDIMEPVIGKNLTHEQIEELEAELWRVRKVAFKALVRDKLKADESFRILQDQIHYCLDEIRRRE